MATTTRTRVRAHREVLKTSPQDLSSELSRVLGRQLVGLIVGKDARTVLRWNAGETKPAAPQERKLRDSYQIYLTLAAVEGDHTIRAWFMGMNPQLDDESPAEVIAAGRAKDVMAAARAFATGG